MKARPFDFHTRPGKRYFTGSGSGKPIMGTREIVEAFVDAIDGGKAERIFR